MRSLKPEIAAHVTQDSSSSIVGSDIDVSIKLTESFGFSTSFHCSENIYSLHKLSNKHRAAYKANSFVLFKNMDKDEFLQVDTLLMKQVLKEAYDDEINILSSFDWEFHEAIFTINRAYSTAYYLTPVSAEAIIRNALTRLMYKSCPSQRYLISEYLEDRFDDPSTVLSDGSIPNDFDLWAFEIIERKTLVDSMVSTGYIIDNSFGTKYGSLFQTCGVCNWSKRLIECRQTGLGISDLAADFLLACLDDGSEWIQNLGLWRSFSRISYSKALVEKLLAIFDSPGHPVVINAKKCGAATNLVKMRAIETFTKVREIISKCCPECEEERILNMMKGID